MVASPQGLLRVFGAEGAILNGERSEPFPCADGSDRDGACAAKGGPSGVWGHSPQRGPEMEPRWGLGAKPPKIFSHLIRFWCKLGNAGSSKTLNN